MVLECCSWVGITINDRKYDNYVSTNDNSLLTWTIKNIIRRFVKMIAGVPTTRGSGVISQNI